MHGSATTRGRRQSDRWTAKQGRGWKTSRHIKPSARPPSFSGKTWRSGATFWGRVRACRAVPSWHPGDLTASPFSQPSSSDSHLMILPSNPSFRTSNGTESSGIHGATRRWIQRGSPEPRSSKILVLGDHSTLIRWNDLEAAWARRRKSRWRRERGDEGRRWEIGVDIKKYSTKERIKFQNLDLAKVSY